MDKKFIGYSQITLKKSMMLSEESHEDMITFYELFSFMFFSTANISVEAKHKIDKSKDVFSA